jgi:HlyD family secretion protein
MSDPRVSLVTKLAAGAALLAAGALLLGVSTARPALPQAATAAADNKASMTVGALGHIQPRNGVRRVSGPSEMVLVLADLLVDIGDTVHKGQPIARLDDYTSKEVAVTRLRASLAAHEADVVRLQATLANAEADYQRKERLQRDGLLTVAALDEARLQLDVARSGLASARAEVEVAKANLKQAEVDLERRVIRSPIDGRVLRVHTRAGEKVGSEGIVELGETGAMYAIAEVYETDLPRIRLGQRATATSPVLPKPLGGTVDRIAVTVGRKKIFDEDPASRRDVRVVEVEVRLDDSAVAAAFTNLQVEVRFAP